MGVGCGERPRAPELHVGVPMGAAGDRWGRACWQAGDPPGSCRLGQLRQAWERPSCQLCPQGWAQHSSRLPAEALAAPA